MADLAPVMMRLVDRTGAAIHFNRAWPAFTGRDPAEELGDGWVEAVHPGDREQCVGEFRRAVADRQPFSLRYRLRRGDGVYRRMLETCVPRANPAGVHEGFVAACVDMEDDMVRRDEREESRSQLQDLTSELESTITALEARTREAEAARARAEQMEERTRFLDDASRVLHSSLDQQESLRKVAELIVPSVADRCVAHLETPDGEMSRMESVTDPGAAHSEVWEDAAAFSSVQRRVMRTGAAELYPELPQGEKIRAEDVEACGELRRRGVHSMMVVPLRTGSRIAGTLSFFMIDSDRRYDVDDLRLAEELARRTAIAIENARLYRETEQASRAKSEFLATMSHELRTPLNAISGYTDLLQLGVSDAAQEREHLDRIKASTWHLLSVIEEILSFSRLEAGREELHVKRVDAVELAQEAAGLVRAAATQKGLHFDLQVPDGPVEIETDRLKVRQILMNLLSNAVKFTDGGTVSLELEGGPDGIVYRVRDTGRGIRAEELDLIYEPFWQAEPGTTRRAGGTGIGLTVARQLSELLGGEMQVRSGAGRGSTFALKLPRSIE